MMKILLLVSVVLFGIHDVISKCPEETIKECTKIFNKSSKSSNICRWTKMLQDCISPFSTVCDFSLEYRRAQHLVEKHGFLTCYCPEMMIKEFMAAFTSKDMCSNQDTLYDFTAFFKMPTCMKNPEFLSVLELQKTLELTC